MSFGSGASGSNSGGGEGRIGGVDGFAGSRICVEVDINRFSISLLSNIREELQSADRRHEAFRGIQRTLAD